MKLMINIKIDKKGRKTSKALKMAKRIDEMFLGTTSVMRLWDNDPDDSTREEIEEALR